MAFPTPTFQEIPLDSLRTDLADLPSRRTDVDDELIRSIGRFGLGKALVVHQVANHYQVIDGFCRLRCLQVLGVDPVPCLVYAKLSRIDRLILRFELNDNFKPWTQQETMKYLRQMKQAKNPAYEEMKRFVLRQRLADW